MDNFLGPQGRRKSLLNSWYDGSVLVEGSAVDNNISSVGSVSTLQTRPQRLESPITALPYDAISRPPNGEHSLWNQNGLSTIKDLLAYQTSSSLDEHQTRTAHANEVRRKVVDWANDHVQNKDYQFMDANGNVGGHAGDWIGGRLANKCNIFLGDAFAAAGVNLRDPDNAHVYLTTRPWGNSRSVIPGFRPLRAGEKAVPGDIMSNGHHIAIFVPDGKRPSSISAASLKSGNEVVHNDWGFRGDEGPITYWRYIGQPARSGKRH